MRYSTLLAIALALLAVATPTQAQVATPIVSVPFTIKKSGNYVLKKNLRLTKQASAAITITADDVTLDLGGRVLSSGLEAGTDVYGIQSGGCGNIVVKNGTVRGFANGIRLNNYQAAVAGVTVDSVRVDKSELTGIDVLGGALIVRHCTVINTGGSPLGATGLSVDGGSAVISDNEVLETVGANGVNAEGIRVGVQSAVIERNRVLNSANNPGFRGLFVALATYYMVDSNYISGFATGIHFTNSTGEYRNNFTTGCTTPYSGGVDAGGNK